MAKNRNFNRLDRIILKPVAFILADVIFVFWDTKAYLKDIPPGKIKRIWVTVFIVPIFILFFIINYLPQADKRLRPRFILTF